MVFRELRQPWFSGSRDSYGFQGDETAMLFREPRQPCFSGSRDSHGFQGAETAMVFREPRQPCFSRKGRPRYANTFPHGFCIYANSFNLESGWIWAPHFGAQISIINGFLILQNNNVLMIKKNYIRYDLDLSYSCIFLYIRVIYSRAVHTDGIAKFTVHICIEVGEKIS